MRSRAGHEVPRRPARRAAGSSAAAGIELFLLMPLNAVPHPSRYTFQPCSLLPTPEPRSPPPSSLLSSKRWRRSPSCSRWARCADGGPRWREPWRVSLSSRFWCSDRKSTRLNSSHVEISYAVFCLKKKKKTQTELEYDKKKKRIKTSQ